MWLQLREKCTDCDQLRIRCFRNALMFLIDELFLECFFRFVVFDGNTRTEAINICRIYNSAL